MKIKENVFGISEGFKLGELEVFGASSKPKYAVSLAPQPDRPVKRLSASVTIRSIIHFSRLQLDGGNAVTLIVNDIIRENGKDRFFSCTVIPWDYDPEQNCLVPLPTDESGKWFAHRIGQTMFVTPQYVDEFGIVLGNE